MIFRTDLALERRELYNEANNLENDLPGIECEEEKPNDKISIFLCGCSRNHTLLSHDFLQ